MIHISILDHCIQRVLGIVGRELMLDVFFPKGAKSLLRWRKLRVWFGHGVTFRCSDRELPGMIGQQVTKSEAKSAQR
jgi:hypothetical protein